MRDLMDILTEQDTREELEINENDLLSDDSEYDYDNFDNDNNLTFEREI